ncbi:MAG: hypothetical protein JWM28_3580 [Chitinophagaceae bacterium]|nr:hypothetical protein [Chitinophagaceae bacterium]
MKNVILSFSTIFFLLFSFSISAQTKDSTDYFIGNWNVLLKGLPQGDTKMFVNFEKKDTALSGTILDSTKTEIAKVSKIEKKGYTVTVYFTAQGYDVFLFMEKKDEDHIAGNMLNMFEAVGDRVKEVK